MYVVLHSFMSQGRNNEKKACGNPKLVMKWYGELPTKVRDKVDICGIDRCIKSILGSDLDVGLIHVLVEHWWDTTHTFWFNGVGEMTMTPKDFTLITGLEDGGTDIQLGRKMHKNHSLVCRLMGQPFFTWTRRYVCAEWMY